VSHGQAVQAAQRRTLRQPSIGTVGSIHRCVAIKADDCVHRRIERLDLVEVGMHHLTSGQLASPEGGGQIARGTEDQFAGHLAPHRLVDRVHQYSGWSRRQLADARPPWTVSVVQGTGRAAATWRRRWAGLLATCSALVLTVGCTGSHPSAPVTLVIATGETSGVYYQYGKGLAGALADRLPDSSSVEVLSSGGSVDNIEHLIDGSAALAFALADTAAQAVNGQPPFEKPVALRAIARLYTNSVHVVVSAHNDAERLADLAGQRVSLGAPGSGTEVTARRMLEVAELLAPGLTGQPPLLRSLGLAESARALAQGQIDAFFWSGGLPTPNITELISTTDVRLLPTDDLLDGMRSRFGAFFVEQSIPASVYGLPGDVNTIGVPNILLVRPDLPADVAELITRTLFEAQEVLIEAHPEARYLDRRTAITTAPVSLHPGAMRYYQDAQP